MAKQRIVNTKLWRDTYILSLKSNDRLLFLWAITNPATELCGAYEAAMVTIELETGLKAKQILESFARFQSDGKILYRNGWVIIRNFAKHQNGTSTNIKKGAERSLSGCPDWVKDTLSKGIDTDQRDTLPRPRPEPRPELEPNGGGTAADAASDPVERRIWTDGRDLLTKSGASKSEAGSLLGKLVKEHTKSLVAQAIAITQAENAANPKTYLIGVLNQWKADRSKMQVGRNDAAEPEYNCPSCFDTGKLMIPDPGGEFAWSMKEANCDKCEASP